VLASADRGRRSGWHKAWASAGRRCGGGNNALPKRGSRVWFAQPQPGKAPIAAEPAARLVALTCTEPPHQATHWAGRAMAKTMDISRPSMQRICQAQEPYGAGGTIDEAQTKIILALIQPHRIRTFKRSRDPSFAAKLTDIVDLDVDPLAHAVVLSLDEKARSKHSTALSRGCPSSRGAGRP
jgi:hypothetical protein